MSTWTTIDAALPVAVCRYSFGSGEAQSLLVGVEGGVAVVSPPCKVPDSTLDAAAAFGPVKALIASNAYHHLGLPAWKKRFPDAKLFAPAQAVARVTKHSGLSGIAPLAEAASMTGPHVDLFDMPHYKSGEVLVRARTAQGCLWYTTDILMNLPTDARGPMVMLFRWTKSGPGFKFNNLASWLMVKDRPALKRWLLERAKEDPPTMILCSHGEAVKLSNPTAELSAVIGA